MQPRISDRILALLIITAHLGIMHPALTYSEEKSSNFRFYQYTPNLNIYEQLTPSEESRSRLLFANINEIANERKQLETPRSVNLIKFVMQTIFGAKNILKTNKNYLEKEKLNQKNKRISKPANIIFLRKTMRN